MLARSGLAHMRLRSFRKISTLLDLLSTSPAVAQIFKVARQMLGGGTLRHPLDGSDGANITVRAQLSVAFHEILRRALAIATDSYLTWPSILVKKLALATLACRFKPEDFIPLQDLNVFSTLKQLINPSAVKLTAEDIEPSREQDGVLCSLHPHCLRAQAPSRSCSKCGSASASSCTVLMGCKPCNVEFCPTCFFSSSLVSPATNVKAHSLIPQKSPLTDAGWALLQVYTLQLKNAVALETNSSHITSQLLDCFKVLRDELTWCLKGLLVPLSAEDKAEYDAAIAQQKVAEAKASQQRDAALQAEVVASFNSLSQGGKLAPSAAASVSTVAPAKFNRGDSVIGLWRSNSKWYTGRIAEDNGNGTYNVHFDDGDVDPQLPARNIKLRGWESSLQAGDSVLASSSHHSDFRSGRIEQVHSDVGLYILYLTTKNMMKAYLEKT